MRTMILGDRKVHVLPNQGKFVLPVDPGYAWVMIPYTKAEMDNRGFGNKQRAHFQVVREGRLATPTKKGAR